MLHCVLVACHPGFGQTCLFTNVMLPKHFNHDSWFTISGNSRKGRFVQNANELQPAELDTHDLHVLLESWADIRPSWPDYD
jgi:hypothetical protein